MKKKKENKQIVKKTALEVKKENLEQIKKYFSNPELLYREENKLITYLDSSNKKSYKKEGKDVSNDLIKMYGLENGVWVYQLSHKKYSSALARMRRKIAEENECEGSIELMLADMIVASYWRIMRYEMVCNRIIENEKEEFEYSQLTINALKEVNKGLEIAHRQHSNNIILLKELKQPSLKLTVKTDNAYFAENQQVINNKNGENLKTNNEIICP